MSRSPRSARTAPVFVLAAVVASGVALSLAGVACGGPKTTDTPPAGSASAPAASASAATSASAAASASAPAAAAASAPASAAPMSSAACDQLVADAQLALDSKRIGTDEACKKDSDCVVVLGRACGFHCKSGVVPKAKEAAWNDLVSKVKDAECKKWNDAECPKNYPKPPPKCTDRVAVCQAGRCNVK